ncbi:MAG: glycosyltransferase [Bacteroidales bacterium]|jgi:hypothetical protein|nr:glycosyltransferase [Bacteroidales bacterium]
MNSLRQKLGKKLLSFFITRELLFFIFQKKTYKTIIDKRIEKVLYGKKRLARIIVPKLIVSLTSFPERIYEIKYTIFSLLDQKILPERIILWLAVTQFSERERDLPDDLLALLRFNFEIRWYHDDIKSYKKLVPAIEQFHDYFIITADDDLYYHKNWLKELWRTHLQHPNDLVCHIAYHIRCDENGQVLPYQKWQHNITRSNFSFWFFPLCGGGAVFNTDLLFKDVCNKELFMKLAPHADDMWFYFMAILNHTRIRVVPHLCSRVKYINPYREYNLIDQYKLADLNIGDNQNDIQFRNLLEYYKINLNLLGNGR